MVICYGSSLLCVDKKRVFDRITGFTGCQKRFPDPVQQHFYKVKSLCFPLGQQVLFLG
jgi:hypothetical protein